jgi:hypothetical protein
VQLYRVEFLHSQGQQRTSSSCRATSALPLNSDFDVAHAAPLAGRKSLRKLYSLLRNISSCASARAWHSAWQLRLSELTSPKLRRLSTAAAAALSPAMSKVAKNTPPINRKSALKTNSSVYLLADLDPIRTVRHAYGCVCLWSIRPADIVQSSRKGCALKRLAQNRMIADRCRFQVTFDTVVFERL